jgi:hypothetical protein
VTGIRVLRDLRTGFGIVRDQGARPTCLAFAASDAHAAARGSPWSLLSAEWAYYHALRRDGGGPASGATLGGMLDALRLDGQPEEVRWPYDGEADPDPASWAPPAGPHELFRRNSRGGGAAVRDVINLIETDTPALLVLTLSDAFFAPGVEGVVDADEPPDPTRVHALVAVGHGILADTNVVVLVRNSWGSGWGVGGHAWLAEAYLAPRLRSCVAMAEEV